jgi:hypothetical protein
VTAARPAHGTPAIDTRRGTDVDPTKSEPIGGARLSRRGALKGLAVGGVATGVAAAGIAAFPSSAAADLTLPTNTKQATTDDLVVLGFLASLERAAMAIYEHAIGTGKYGSDIEPTLGVIQVHHQRHGAAYDALAGKAAPLAANARLVKDWTAKIDATTSRKDAVQALADLEGALIATGEASIAQVASTDPASRIASILATDARHQVALGQVGNLDPAGFLPAFESTKGALTVSDYPLG